MAGWGIGLGIIAAVVVIIYDSVADHFALIDQFMKTMPPIFTAFAGDAQMLKTPSGWLHMKYFVSLPVIFGPFAVMAGAGLLAADEERGRLDLLMAYPTPRWKIFFGRLAALFAATAIILVAAWLGLIAALPFSTLEVTPGASFLPFVSLFALIVLFESFALLLSFILGSRILAAGAAGVVPDRGLFHRCAGLHHALARPARPLLALPLLPRWNRSRRVPDGPFLVLIATATVMVGFAFWLFQRSDIRVMGEGTFRWPLVMRARRNRT